MPNPCLEGHRQTPGVGLKKVRSSFQGGKPLGHKIAVVVDKASAAVEFDGTVTVVDLEMEGSRAEMAGRNLCQIEELRANSLPPVGGFDEEFVDPGTFAAIFEAEIETNDEVGDGSLLVARQVGDAVIKFWKRSERFFRTMSSLKGSSQGSSFCMRRIRSSSESTSA